VREPGKIRFVWIEFDAFVLELKPAAATDVAIRPTAHAPTTAATTLLRTLPAVENIEIEDGFGLVVPPPDPAQEQHRDEQGKEIRRDRM